MHDELRQREIGVTAALRRLGDHHVAAGLTPQPSRTFDENRTALGGLLDAEPAVGLASWCSFAQQWADVDVAPLMAALDPSDPTWLDEMRASGGWPIDSALLLGGDAVPVGIDDAGAFFFVSPARRSVEPSRILQVDGDGFFFLADPAARRSRHVETRDELPTFESWILELVAAHLDGRIVRSAAGDVDVPGFVRGEGYRRHFPWPAAQD